MSDRSPARPNLPQIAPRRIAPAQQRDELKIHIAGPGEDPEAAPVERHHAIGIQLTHGGRALSGALEGATIASTVSEDYGRAGALAQNLRTRCAGCVHFDRDAGRPFVQQLIAEMKANTLRDQHGRPRDLPSQLAARLVVLDRESVAIKMGLCRAISEIMKGHSSEELRKPWMVHPDGGCPAPAQLMGPGGEDLSKCYEARDFSRHSKSAGDTAYDKVLNTAAGKKE